MISFITVLIILGSLALIGIFVWIIVLAFGKNEEYLINNPFIINFSSQFTNGHAYGIERKAIKAKENRTYVEFGPLDDDPNLVNKIPDEKTIIGQNKRIIIPNGSWSRHRSMGFYLPNTASDIPDELKNTEIGKIFMYWTEAQNVVNAEIDSLKKGGESKDEILKRLSGGELSREYISKLHEFQIDIIKLIANSKLKDDNLSKTPDNLSRQ